MPIIALCGTGILLGITVYVVLTLTYTVDMLVNR